jgi:DNA-directed RNA polymerase specialized sigma24 family protein
VETRVILTKTVQNERKRSTGKRASVNLRTLAAVTSHVKSRLEHLPSHDRALLEQVLVRGVALHEVAALTGEDVRRLRRRIKNAIARTYDPGFDAVTSLSREWAPDMASVGAAVFLHGRSATAAAAEAGIPQGRALSHVRTIRALGEAIKAERRRRGEAA